MSATQKDIAQRLNLSRALVGQVLGDSPDVRVSEETRQRVVSAAREMNYRPHLAAFLKRQGAPIQYVGFQNHGGLEMPDPEAVLRSLDQFATLGLPLEVTEFEVTLQNGQDPAQCRYQADYVRDYLTAVFSHPSVRAVLLQDFWQPGAWQYEGASAFFSADWSANPHGKVYEDLVLHQW